jgi:hypothetical protein
LGSFATIEIKSNFNVTGATLGQLNEHFRDLQEFQFAEGYRSGSQKNFDF